MGPWSARAPGVVCRPGARRSSERCSISPEEGYPVEGGHATLDSGGWPALTGQGSHLPHGERLSRVAWLRSSDLVHRYGARRQVISFPPESPITSPEWVITLDRNTQAGGAVAGAGRHGGVERGVGSVPAPPGAGAAAVRPGARPGPAHASGGGRGPTGRGGASGRAGSARVFRVRSDAAGKAATPRFAPLRGSGCGARTGARGRTPGELAGQGMLSGAPGPASVRSASSPA